MDMCLRQTNCIRLFININMIISERDKLIPIFFFILPSTFNFIYYSKIFITVGYSKCLYGYGYNLNYVVTKWRIHIDAQRDIRLEIWNTRISGPYWPSISSSRGLAHFAHRWFRFAQPQWGLRPSPPPNFVILKDL